MPLLTPNTLTSDRTIDYVMQYGGRCRDCADHDGICPNSNLPCDPDDRKEAITRVLDAAKYGITHGYIER